MQEEARLTTFDSFIRRIRAGDEQAAIDLVKQYESLIRREVRVHLLDRRLLRAFDSMDICQSVWFSFFVRAAAGQYDLDNPQCLLRLLIQMTRNKLASAARHEHRQVRDQRRRAQVDTDFFQRLPDTTLGMDHPPDNVDRLVLLKAHLSQEERQLLELRAAGLNWQEIANRLGG